MSHSKKKNKANLIGHTKMKNETILWYRGQREYYLFDNDLLFLFEFRL